MATSVMLPSSNPNLSPIMNIEDNLANLRVASFSSYLNPVEENFVLKLSESLQKPSLTKDLDIEPSCPIMFSRTNSKEGEIGVFGAKKYFTMKIDGASSPGLSESDSSTHWISNEDRTDLRTRPRARSETFSATSEASTWNGQAALFPSFIRNPSQNKHKNAIGNRFFTGFACRGSCNDGKSVHIKRSGTGRRDRGKKVMEKSIQNGLNSITSEETIQYEGGLQHKDWNNSQRFEKMSFEFSREGLQKLAVIENLKKGKELEEGRKSLEVFGLETMKKGDIAANMERKLSVLTWDAIPKSQNLPTTTSLSTEKCEDMESDASSDLFELENISCGMSTCMTPTTIYAPSEASIEWSVVTASAADFSTDTDEKKPAETNKNKAIKGKEWGKSRPGGLLGCRSEKAVGVWENACRSNNNEKAKVKGFEFPQVQHSTASRVLPSSHPALSSFSRYM